MDTKIGKTIVGTFLVLLGIPGILFALAFFFFGESGLAERIIFLVISGFLPLIFLIFGLKLLLPFIFDKSRGNKIPSEEIEKLNKKDVWRLPKENNERFSYTRRYRIVITEEDREKLKNVNLLMGGIFMVILKTWTDWFREIREVRKMHLGMSFYAGMMES